jgi:hypothetical protein
MQSNLISTIVFATLLDIVNKTLFWAYDCQNDAVEPVGGLVNTFAGVVTLTDASSMVLVNPKSPPSQATVQLANALDALGAQTLTERILNDPTNGCKEVVLTAIPPHESIILVLVMEFTVPFIVNL